MEFIACVQNQNGGITTSPSDVDIKTATAPKDDGEYQLQQRRGEV